MAFSTWRFSRRFPRGISQTLQHVLFLAGGLGCWLAGVSGTRGGEGASPAPAPVSSAPAAVIPLTSPAPPQHALEGHTEAVYCVEASPDGRWLASGGFDHSVRLWDAVTGKLVKTFAGHEKMVLCVQWSPDSRRIVSGGLDNTVKVWPVDAVAAEKTAAPGSTPPKPGGAAPPAPAKPDFFSNFAGHAGQVYGVACSPDGKLIASCGAEKSVRLWDLATNRELRIFTTELKDIIAYSLAFHPSGKSLLVGYNDGKVRVFDVETGKLAREGVEGKSAVYSVAYNKSGSRFATAGLEKQIRLWRASDGGLELAFPAHEDDIYRVQFNPAGTHLVSCGYSGTVRVWNATNGQCLLAAKVPTLVYNVCYLAAGDRVAVAGGNQKIYVISLPASAR